MPFSGLLTILRCFYQYADTNLFCIHMWSIIKYNENNFTFLVCIFTFINTQALGLALCLDV